MSQLHRKNEDSDEKLSDDPQAHAQAHPASSETRSLSPEAIKAQTKDKTKRKRPNEGEKRRLKINAHNVETSDAIEKGMKKVTDEALREAFFTIATSKGIDPRLMKDVKDTFVKMDAFLSSATDDMISKLPRSTPVMN